MFVQNLEQLIQLLEKYTLRRLVGLAKPPKKVVCCIVRNIFAQVSMSKRDVQPAIRDTAPPQIDEMQLVMGVNEDIGVT